MDKIRLITLFRAPVQSVRIFDTLSGEKEEFAAIANSNNSVVKMLLCGPTVYDYSHVGHARMLLFYDLMSRHFRAKGMHVSAIVNITDVDPKIFKKAKATNTPPSELAAKFIGELLRDLSALGIEGFAFARVSHHVGTAQELVAGLLRDGRAYSAGGNIYLDTSKILSFGRLARMSRQDLRDCRLDISPAKKLPEDILLWNASENLDVAFFDATLGSGIPWWHMQDSSVAVAGFGGSYDIHGGANELVYPHHESHLAQLQAITSLEKPVKFWTHVGLVRAKGRKMSKSLGNTITIRDLLKKRTANALRLYLYSRHYRNDFDFSENHLDSFERISDAIAAALNSKQGSGKSKLIGRFFERIEDDFDTPGAIKVMVEAARVRSPDLNAMVNILGLQY